MSGIIAIIAFLFLLGILVLAHEIGHFATARAFGIAVDEFGIGFPPRAITIAERKGVRYTINWLPIGGFVRFSGVGDNSSYGIGSLREAPIYQRIAVLLAGPVMNIIVAIAIFSGLTLAHGIDTIDTGLVVNQVYANTPAAIAGLQSNDVVMRVANGNEITIETNMGDIAKLNVGKSVPIEILRSGNPLTLQITPGPWTINGQTNPAGFGFAYTHRSHTTPVNLGQAIIYGTAHTFSIAGMMLESLQALVKSLLGLAPKIENAGMTGIVGMARGTGEIIDRDGWQGYLNWMALISINLGIFNLLPIPALDGSHIMFALFEFIRRRRIPVERESLVHMVGFGLLMALMVVVTISDIQGWMNGTSIFGQ
ncbi:MAG: M50 family metallopeptidase [Chloroflexales bacterium]|nr:M50 family metallopeptidase [Chloroflexales bacterium]